MSKLLINTTTEELVGVCKIFECYIKNDLGYENPSVEIELHPDNVEITLSAVDKFMEKLEYNDRYRLLLWEVANYNSSLDEVVKNIWYKLESHLPRAARELRYSLICLSKVTDVDINIESEVARAVFGEIKVLRDKLAEKLLSYEPGQNPIEETEDKHPVYQDESDDDSED